MIRSMLMAAVLGLLVSCAPRKDGSTGAQSLEGTWELVVFPRGNQTFSEIFGHRRPELSFSLSNNRFSGTTGCNRISGTFSHDGDRLSFGNVISTRMACGGYNEQLFLDALSGVNRHQFSEAKLEMLRDSTVLMIYTKKQP